MITTMTKTTVTITTMTITTLTVTTMTIATMTRTTMTMTIVTMMTASQDYDTNDNNDNDDNNDKQYWLLFKQPLVIIVAGCTNNDQYDYSYSNGYCCKQQQANYNHNDKQ